MIVTRFRINALIGTLAMSFVVGGIGAIATHGNLVVLFDHPEFQAFASTKILGLTSAAWMMIVVAIAMAILLSRTTFGRYVYATGGNAEAARLGRRPDQHRPGGDVRAERRGRRPRRDHRRVTRPERPGVGRRASSPSRC